MNWLFAQTGSGTLAAIFFVVGAIAGGLASRWASALTPPGKLERDPNETAAQTLRWDQLILLSGRVLSAERSRSYGSRVRQLTVELATGLLFAAYVLAAVRLDCQQITEVRPDDFWKYARVFYQLVLLTLLVTATITDFQDYLIPESITLPGILTGLTGAFLSGQLQMVHLWIDWNQEIPGIRGPEIPNWLDAHRHWHGLAWSVAGGVVGAGLTWGVRSLSSRILRREALGFGDVTLMAMIGTFLGWQPTIFVFALAPLCGLVFALPLQLFARKPYLPYGPFLAAATVIVLFSWKWLWLSTRLMFGDPLGLALLIAIATVLFVILLVVLRIYKSRQRKRDFGRRSV